MEAQEFFGGVARFVAAIGVFAVVSMLAGLVPLAIGWLLGQKRLGVYGFLATVATVIATGPMFGAVGLVISSLVVLVISVSRRRAGKAYGRIGAATRREE